MEKANISIGEALLILFPILTFALIFLKLFKFINCSWLWIFAPLWIPTSIIGTILLFVVIMLNAYKLPPDFKLPSDFKL